MLRGWGVGSDALDDAELVVSELVTNSFLHGGAAEAAIELSDHGDVVRLEVAHREDADTGGGPVGPLTVGADETHGRGLAIVDVLASAWGVLEADGLRRVWAELPGRRTGVVAAADRTATLGSLVRTLDTAADVPAVGDAVTGWCHDRLGTRLAGVALVDPERVHLRYLSLSPVPAASAARWAVFPVSLSTPPSAVLATGAALFHESRNAVVAAFPDLGPALATVELASFANLALRRETVPFGVLTLGWRHGRELDADDRRWLSEVAGVVAAALARHGAGATPDHP